MNHKEQFITINSYINWYGFQIVPKHELHYLEYGDPQNKQVIICAHGLTRNAYDFNKIATALSNDYRVISLSYPGRGKSQYFNHSKYYNYPVYVKDSLLFLKKLNIRNPIWLGTSMGGLIGMIIASKFPRLLKGLVMNDVGPFLPFSTLAKIKKYASQATTFDNLMQAKEHVKLIYGQFGIKEEEDWDYLTQHSFKLNAENKYIMNYDPAIATGLKISTQAPVDVDLWNIWFMVNCPLMVIHGAKSDILQLSTLEKMKISKKLELLTIEYAGHAPSLMSQDQILPIKQWIDQLCKK